MISTDDVTIVENRIQEHDADTRRTHTSKIEKEENNNKK